jgi:hypothetical protein
MLWYQAGCCWAPRGRGHHENATLAVVRSRHGRRPGLPAACAHGVQVEHVHAAEPVAASPVDPLHERHDELGDQARWGFGTAGAGGWLLDGHGAAFQRAAAVSASAGRPAAASHRERRAGGGRSGAGQTTADAATARPVVNPPRAPSDHAARGALTVLCGTVLSGIVLLGPDGRFHMKAVGKRSPDGCAWARRARCARPRRGERGGERGRTAQVGSRLATTAATAVVIGTEATSPMLPTSVRTISVATSSVVTTSPSARPEMLKISISGSEAPA